MISNELAVAAHALRKEYHLYRSQRERLRHMLGLLPAAAASSRRFVALDGVSLRVERGEKVAIIGRNGAGKSTLLKLITGATKPTSGDLHVGGRVHPLLQLGTGFHPEFTGRQNAHAYFVQHGVAKADLAARIADAIAFAEIGEYIDQPVKTYSTGMGVRLMFAVSTAITPDLLLLDEVLGVGDAYFTQKSFDRVRTLCSAASTTLLLVTHDLYSAAQVCDRVIWLDRGRVKLDGDVASVIKAYEDSIRHQEEDRLRRVKEARAKALGASREELLIELRPRDGFLPAPVFFRRVALTANGAVRQSLAIGDTSAFDDRSSAHLVESGSAWGAAQVVDGSVARPFLNYGSPYRKASLVFDVSGAGAHEQLGVALEYRADARCELEAHVFKGATRLGWQTLPPAGGNWTTSEMQLRQLTPAEQAPVVTGMHGTGAIVLTSVRTLNANGDEQFVFTHGEPFRVEVSYRINAPQFSEHVQWLVAFLRDGVHDVSRLATDDLPIEGPPGSTGVVTASLAHCGLGAGRYSVTVLAGKHGYYNEMRREYFSLSADVHACLSRVLDIEVRAANGVAHGTGSVLAADWELTRA